MEAGSVRSDLQISADTVAQTVDDVQKTLGRSTNGPAPSMPGWGA
ncbi:MAG TPA: hypothetical protein VFW69_14245 [Mycobacterium sp.]|nr:hypothetical protein [Mycobacterium sp.]